MKDRSPKGCLRHNANSQELAYICVCVTELQCPSLHLVSNPLHQLCLLIGTVYPMHSSQKNVFIVFLCSFLSSNGACSGVASNTVMKDRSLTTQRQSVRYPMAVL